MSNAKIWMTLSLDHQVIYQKLVFPGPYLPFHENKFGPLKLSALHTLATTTRDSSLMDESLVVVLPGRTQANYCQIKDYDNSRTLRCSIPVQSAIENSPRLKSLGLFSMVNLDSQSWNTLIRSFCILVEKIDELNIEP